jgi:hypothetical protein
MKFHHSAAALAFSTLAFSTLGLLSTASMASAFTFTQKTGTVAQVDTNWYNTLDRDYAFVAAGMIGNNATNGTQEAEIHSFTANNTRVNPTTAMQRQFQWTNGQKTPFKVIYSAATGQVSYTLAGLQAISYTATNGTQGVTDLFLRTRSAFNATTTSSTASISDLVLNGSALANRKSEAKDGSVDYLQISGLSGDFTLEGNVSLAWQGTRPSNANLAFQIKAVHMDSTAEAMAVGQAAAVPEPMTMAGIALAGAGLAGVRRRQAQAAAREQA